MIPKIIHYIFFDLGKNKKIEDFPIFLRNLEKCKKINNNFEIKLWQENDVEKIISKYDFYEDYKNFKYSIQRVDLAKYLILYEYGGIYSDLDLEPLDNCTPLLDKSILLCDSPREHCQNNCIGSEKKNPLFLSLVKYSVNQYHEKIKNKIYETWLSRFIIQTTGPKMMARFFKNYKQIPTSQIVDVPDFDYYVKKPYFKDYCTKTWMPKVYYNDNKKLIN
jgi:inositol phosphorylceramide mannosyltransferase catalytic subunit